MLNVALLGEFNSDSDNLADEVAAGRESSNVCNLCFGNKVEGINVKDLVHGLPQESAVFCIMANKLNFVCICIIYTPLNGFCALTYAQTITCTIMVTSLLWETHYVLIA